MDIPQVRKNLETLPDEIEVSEKEYLKEKGILKSLEDNTKSLLANLKLKYTDVKTNADRETRALADPDFKKHLDGISVQRREVGIKEARFHALHNKFESMRSLNKNV